MIRESFEYIATNYLRARSEAFAEHEIARFIREQTRLELEQALDQPGLLIRGSPGQGGWAEVPWIAIFDPLITTSATKGYYVVYLFSATMDRVLLSLNQGTTSVREEFGKGTHDELSRRAELMRSRLGLIPSTQPNLQSDQILPRDYEIGHAHGIEYELTNLPAESELVADLEEYISLYRRLTALGGLSTFEGTDQSADDGGNSTIVEKRRYRLHRRIDRNSKAAKAAKKVHGYKCQSCGFDFQKIYGDSGHDYIEAHHLTPLSTLPENKEIPQDPKRDFAVLCSNCHRMIHRAGAPDTVQELARLPQVAALRDWLKNR